jgi:hypothetical protein
VLPPQLEALPQREVVHLGRPGRHVRFDALLVDAPPAGQVVLRDGQPQLRLVLRGAQRDDLLDRALAERLLADKRAPREVLERARVRP